MHVGTGLASEQRLWWQWKVSGRYREEPVTQRGREKKGWQSLGIEKGGLG